MKSSRTLLFGVLFAGAATLAHADLAYTFDTDAQGFTVDPSSGVLSHVAEGYLRVQDLTGENNVSLQFPQASLVGGWASYLGGKLSFDARLESPITNAYWPEFGTVTLFGQDGFATVDVALGDEPGLGWQTYSVTLNPASFSTTPAELSAVLASLQKVDISLEAGNGPIEVIHVDNVKVTAVPEPATWAMAGLGVLAVAGSLGRRTARR
ncbi:MAG: PEP-CTERM sorting domain-containing protein [Rubrivivax sp.]|nr:MAG: PEP-CTERM sorting domain-containing protein [Rubrivivax sp.]